MGDSWEAMGDWVDGWCGWLIVWLSDVAVVEHRSKAERNQIKLGVGLPVPGGYTENIRRLLKPSPYPEIGAYSCRIRRSMCPT